MDTRESKRKREEEGELTRIPEGTAVSVTVAALQLRQTIPEMQARIDEINRQYCVLWDKFVYTKKQQNKLHRAAMRDQEIVHKAHSQVYRSTIRAMEQHSLTTRLNNQAIHDQRDVDLREICRTTNNALDKMKQEVEVEKALNLLLRKQIARAGRK